VYVLSVEPTFDVNHLLRLTLVLLAGAIAACLLPLSSPAQTFVSHVPKAQAATAAHVSDDVNHDLRLPADVTQAMDKMYGGDPDAAILAFRQLQQRDPWNPLGYILEAEARWWKIYCSASTVKWGMVDAWKRGKLPSDSEYLALLDREIALATATESTAGRAPANAPDNAPANNSAAAPESAERHLYAGIGLALKARMYALQGDNHATAHAAVAARREFLRTVQMNPNLTDAYTGLGLYNYYVDTLGPIVKMLRFLMGIPGGNRKLGIQQLERGMKDGQLTAVEARFYLATSLRTYDHDYQRALTIAQPLAARYPGNPIFLLVIGNLQQERGDHAAATAAFRAVETAPIHDSTCAARVRQLVSDILSPPR
jgi:hypothetical protein